MPCIVKRKDYVENNIDIHNETVHNKLEKELEAVLKPLNVIEIFFFCRKYKICNGRITPNSTLYSIISVIFTFVLLIFCGYYMFGSSFTNQLKGFEYFVHCCKLIFYCFLFISFLLNCFINIFHGNRIICFILKLQNVYKILKMFANVKSLTFSNWCYIVVLHAYHCFWILSSYICFVNQDAGYYIISYFWAILDTHLLYAFRLMKLLILPLENLVKIIKLTRFDEEESLTNMLEMYKDLLEAYRIFEEAFEILVLEYFFVIYK